VTKRLALCIGIDKYKHMKNMSLRFAEADATSLSKVLREKDRGNFKCASLLGRKATRSNIVKSIKRILMNSDLKQDDFVFIYYSGHGGLDENSNLFLVASDSKPNSKIRNELDISTCVHIKELEIGLDNTKAGTVIFIADACFSGALGKALSRIKYRSNANMVFVGACRSDQVSVETEVLKHGLFTSCFLNGLNQVPTEGEWITLHQLLSHIDSEMNAGKKQTVEISAHYVDPNILISKNPLFRIVSNSFNEEIQGIFQVDGSKIVAFRDPSCMFVAEQIVGLHESKIGVMVLDNSLLKITEGHIDQFISFIESGRNRKELDRGILVSRHTIEPALVKKIQKSMIADYKTKSDLIRDLMNLEPYLRDLVNKFENGDPATPRQPPLEKIYIEPVVNAIIKKSENPISEDSIDESLDAYESHYSEDSARALKQVPLTEVIDKWLLLREPRLAILGEYGFGKTVFCKKLAYEMAKGHLRGVQNRIPILIDLGRFPKVAIDLEALIIDHLSRVCNIKNPSWTAFKTMNQAGLFLLIFDGLDEMAIRTSKETLLRNIFEIEKLAGAELSKAVLTSRPEYFWSKEEEEETFESNEFEQRPSYLRVSLLPFSDKQVEQFLMKRIPFIKAAKHGWKYYLDNVQRIYDLPDLSKRPVFLEMIAQTLPQLIEEGRSISRSSLYKQYLINEIKRQSIEKNRKLLLSAEKRLELMTVLAIELFRKKLDSVSSSEVPKIVQEHLSEPQRQELEAHISDFLTCSFLRRIENRFGFSHATFKEFLVSETLFKELEGNSASDYEQSQLTNPIIDFLAEREMNEKILWNWIDSTKKVKSSRARKSFLGGNAISILNRKGITFANRDLSGTNLWAAKLENANLSNAKLKGADLSRADLTSSDLGGADCTNAKFCQSNLRNADLSNARLEETDFSGSILNGAKLDKVDLHGVILADFALKSVSLVEADLHKANLIGANLEGANMRGANLSNANLERANLSGADLCQSDLRGANLNTDLNECRLSGIAFNKETDLSGAIIDVNRSLERGYIDEKFALHLWEIE